MSVNVRVLVSEDQEICSIQMQVSCNARVRDILEEVAEFTNENKYKLSVLKDGK